MLKKIGYGYGFIKGYLKGVLWTLNTTSEYLAEELRLYKWVAIFIVLCTIPFNVIMTLGIRIFKGKESYNDMVETISDELIEFHVER